MNRQSGFSWAAVLFLLPFATAFLVFFVGPTFFGLGMSFFDWEMLSGLPPRWVGGGNYLEALQDARFHRSLLVTGLFVFITVPLNLFASLGLAAGVSALPKRQGVYRSLIYLPVLLNITVASLLWRWFFNTKFGLFNKLLQPWGVELPWLTDPALALPSISLMTVWWTSGVSFLILLTAFQQVSPSLYEAAEIDGATAWQKFRFVSLPQIMPVVGFCLLLEVLASFKVFGQPFLMTGGGPEGATRVAMQYIYETGFSFFRMGYASALSWIAFLLIFVVMLLHRIGSGQGSAKK
ncbi:MAG: sugar ABC transporter permease [Verrucomicrobia bacterium]|nr:sugar ABC transporter permease [Verrucomicrobiota bacterium]